MDAISFKSKFKNHSEAKKALVEYYTAFSAAVVTSRPQLLDSQFGFTFGSSGWVNRTSDMIETSKQFSNYISRCLQFLQSPDRKTVHEINRRIDYGLYH